jgi:hypothetical protein
MIDFIQLIYLSSFGFFIKYVVKILMGGVDSWFDNLDEKKVGTDGYGRPTGDPGQKQTNLCCIIL